MINIDKNLNSVVIEPVRSTSLTILILIWFIGMTAMFIFQIKVFMMIKDPRPIVYLVLSLNFLFQFFGIFALRWCWCRLDKISFDGQWIFEKSGLILKKKMILKKDEVYDMVVCKRPGSLDSVSNYKFLGVGLWMLKIKSKRGNLNIGLGITKEDATKIRDTFKQHFT